MASEVKESNSQPLGDLVVKYIDQTVADIKNQTEGLVVQSQFTQFIPEHNEDFNMDVTVEGDADKGKNTENMMDTGQPLCSDIHPKERQSETNCKENTEFLITNTEAGQRGEDREVLEVTLIGGEEKVKPAGKFVP